MWGLAEPAALKADCSPMGQVEAKVGVAPEQGRVRIVQGATFPNYVPGDPPYACDARRSPATIIIYRASRCFSGEDATAVKIVFPYDTRRRCCSTSGCCGGSGLSAYGFRLGFADIHNLICSKYLPKRGTASESREERG